MTEELLWKRIRKRWRGHAVRVEASLGGVDPGTPDSNLSVDGKGGWVELKVWPTPLNEVQKAWHLDAEDRGAYCVVLCWTGNDKVWVGRGEIYTRYVGKGTRPEGVSLQAALDGIESALIGK